jgi:hypothetical protein
MARTGSTVARIERLEAALIRAKKLPEGTVFKSLEMSSLVGASWNSLRSWCDAAPHLEDENCYIRGDNGSKYQFNPVATIEGLLKVFRTEVERSKRKNKDFRKSIGIELEEEDLSLDAKELADRIDVTLRLERAKLDQQLRSDTRIWTDFIEGYNRKVVGGIMGGSTRVDAANRLPPAVKVGIREYLLEVAANTHAEAEEFVEAWRANLLQARAGRTIEATR